MNIKDPFLWSFGWWVENDKAWFIEEKNNILFCVDLKTRKYEEVVYIPDTNLNKYLLTPLCMKYDREIWCIPGRGQSIWIYHLDDMNFRTIDFEALGRKNLLAKFFIWNDSLFIVPLWWDKIVEINLQKKEIENYHTICKKDIVVESVMAAGSIYMVSSKFDKIYEFDLKQKMIKRHMIPNDDKKKYQCICFDGEKFWLSGYRKEVYEWNKRDNRITTITGFPSDFGVYDFSENTHAQPDCSVNCYEYPSFLHVVAMGNYVWFIPWQTNKILYIDKKTYEISVYEIDEEQENRKSILSRAAGRKCKYGVAYLRNDRYIGLLSVKNNCVLEIDTKELKHQWIDYYYSEKCLQQCRKIFKGVYFEKDVLQTMIYKTELQNEDKTDGVDADYVGGKIYRAGRDCIFR
ncbi:hypothetical protein C823_005418 [Eubacterium plexicaudatum ASF492]|uniref:Uncharacterized protein n=1 Tax=Eubacterium plexicaudatum ASF492 TaxID=1235802 RepID=N2B0Q4_9FIRM|nr:hypothetical protein C823_005418 [Eubacterium plexicaudatum ASF492]